MTTIVTNGHYLIADHRVTNNFKIESSTHVIENQKETMYDTHNKIFVIPIDKVVTLKDKRIKAFAYAGSAGVYAYLVELIKTSKDTNINLYQALRTLSKYEHGQFIAVNYDSTSTKAILKGFHNNGSYLQCVNEIGKLIIVGSGSEPVSELLFKIGSGYNIVDAFHTAVMFDNYTSPSFSVFGVEENHLFTNVLYPIEEIKKSFDRIMTLVINSDKFDVRSIR